MKAYIEIKNNHEDDLTKLNQQYNGISACRLLVFLILAFMVYKSFMSPDQWYILGALISLFSFIFCLRWHQKISTAKNVKKTLIDINNKEILYLKGDTLSFKNGMEYANTHHFYTFDLDIFGDHSLYQNLNRTNTYIGQATLASLLSSKCSKTDILLNQEAIKELSQKIDWRQMFAAHAILSHDNKDNYQKLMHWAQNPVNKSPKILYILSWVMPILFFVSLLIAYFKGSDYLQIVSTLFTFNLIILYSQVKNIKNYLIDSDQISSIIRQYGLMINLIEKEVFKSQKMKILQDKLKQTKGSVSGSIIELSNLISNIQSIQNLMGAIIMNGSMLYHVQVLIKLMEWKKNNAAHIHTWLDIIGEVESLNSLANLAHNNPDFCFPELNDAHQINFNQLGHPLISKEKRVCNEVTFQPETMIILTGSNMSGKSTFLRTLGINMVLGGIGSVVCAVKANIHPLPVIVSMRQTDSLSDSESYFFAEVKRLKQLIDQLTQEKCFVLLDEILKGTNSDDKQTGTIAVIKKMISKSAIGAIATHDLEVCKTTEQYPNQLINKCFEVEIIDDDLVFDYKLRDGICQNKSATFLMKKLKVI
ncbi:MAG: DNA mismatch repair protein [Saprospiraceae bacterium]|nr:DNA mismatch repair protein [Saprospiraceae bacterium]